MNIKKTNPIGLFFAENGPFQKKTIDEYLKNSDLVLERNISPLTGHENIICRQIDKTKPSANIPGGLLFKNNRQKVYRLSKKTIENASLVNADSVIKNCSSIDYNFTSIFILLDSDDSGYIKCERYGSDIHFLYAKHLNKKESFSINCLSLFTGEFLWEEHESGSCELFLQILTYLFFGDITTRLVKAKQTLKLNSFSKFLNNSKTDITFVDTLWKERISTEGFKVRGHFRLQPVGEGRKDKRLIWIDEFDKHGYNRKATKELSPLN